MSLKLGLNTGFWASGVPSPAALEAVKEAERLGFDSIWTSEAYGCDVLTPLAWWGSQTETVRLGTAIMQMSARRPTAAAMAAMTMDHLSGGPLHPRPGRLGPAGRRGLVRRAVRKAAGPHARVRLDRAQRHRPAGARHVRRRALPAAANGREGITGLGKPLKSTLHPLRERIPLCLGAEGPKNIALTAEIADGWLALFYSPPPRRRALPPHASRRASPRRDRPHDDFEIHASIPFVVRRRR
jgi:alkanesulfonate monooxygenase SsuD/methylene tetrahydromethanopterin reductase-like flavin-dependent oxidoreductase (luciferase family)